MKSLLLALACCTLAVAQTSKPVPVSQAKWDYFSNVTIAAGQTVNLDSTVDFSSSTTLQVSVRSATTDLPNLVGTAYFTVPEAKEFVSQEVMLGSNFYYANTGGVTFQVCGPTFRLALRNLGTATMTLSSVIIYAHVI